MILLDGKKTAASTRAKLKGKIAALEAEFNRTPGLAVILVGNDPGSQVYVRNKEKACTELGIRSTMLKFTADISQNELEAKIRELNADDAIDGVLLQLPLPAGLNSQRCLDLILPEKDVDGFHPANVGCLTLGLPGLQSCTPAGVMTLLEEYDLDVAGKKAVVIGRSNIVGKPLALMLLQKNATVTICHSRTQDLKSEVLQADFVFAAVGIAKFITGDMLKKGAVVVDVGMNRTDEGLCGDCDFDSLSEIASAMTPVPGGVGPMTIAQLMVNTVQAFESNCR